MADGRRLTSTPIARTDLRDRSHAGARRPLPGAPAGDRLPAARHGAGPEADERRRGTAEGRFGMPGTRREGHTIHGRHEGQRPHEERRRHASHFRGEPGGRFRTNPYGSRHDAQAPQIRGYRRSRRGLPARRHRALLTPVAGLALALALAFVMRSCLGTMSPKAIGGTGGIERSPLFDGGDSGSYSTSLLLPAEFAPLNPAWPQVSGTRRIARGVMKELVAATQEIEEAGYEVGYVLYDIGTGITVTYNADTAFYSASSIKGPYVTSLAAYELGDAVTSEARRISSVIEYSDNASYSSLRNAYGSSAFSQLVADSGASAMPSHGATEDVEREREQQSGSSISDNHYEFLTPRQLLALWKTGYDYLSSGSSGAEWLASEFEKPQTSALRITAGSLGTTWSKAGWYPGEESGYGITVDAGAIRTEDGDFLIAVMTTKPEDFTAMETIVSPLVTLRAALTT